MNILSEDGKSIVRLDGIETGFEEIQRIIDDCQRFLVQSNLETIARYSHLL